MHRLTAVGRAEPLTDAAFHGLVTTRGRPMRLAALEQPIPRSRCLTWYTQDHMSAGRRHAKRRPVPSTDRTRQNQRKH
jgi:hypothetical protein